MPKATPKDDYFHHAHYAPLIPAIWCRVKQWMARTTAGITKDGATPMPTPSAEPDPVGEAPEAAPNAEPAEAAEEEPLPVVNLEECKK